MLGELCVKLPSDTLAQTCVSLECSCLRVSNLLMVKKESNHRVILQPFTVASMPPLSTISEWPISIHKFWSFVCIR